MCWQCDHPDETLDGHLADIRETIRRYGWAVQCVEDHRRPLAYTIGLHDRGRPELLVTGLNPQQSGWLLNTFAKRMLTGPTPAAGQQLSLPAGTRLEVVDVERPDAHLPIAIAIAGTDLEAVQLVWADGRGRWPWAPGFDDGQRRQPVLGARAKEA